MALTIAPKIAFPGGNTGPVIQFLPFRAHVVKAFDLTNAALVNLAPQAPGVVNIMDPLTLAYASANAAVKEVGLAVQQDAPTAGLDAAKAALTQLTQGVFQMSHRLNGPLNTGQGTTTRGQAEPNLQAALDGLGAAQSRI
ncbi:MAG: hypothetical protein H7123_01160 [Thermoleophilia bacterium]|nr:hypothetical protein [Thermoleophilia bacterium]